jgi:hypothetical protein
MDRYRGGRGSEIATYHRTQRLVSVIFIAKCDVQISDRHLGEWAYCARSHNSHGV